MQELNTIHNNEFTNRLLSAQHIFNEIYEACNFTHDVGIGSYLILPEKYEYCSLMYDKQLLLYNCVKNMTNVLEIGTYMGHSLLIMLLSNPTLKITCIDINDKYTRPAVNILNKYFNNSVTFIHSDSLNALTNINEKFDFFHIDGIHINEYITKEFYLIKNLNSNNNSLEVLFDDQNDLIGLQNEIMSNYKVIKYIKPACIHNNVYFKIQL